MWREASKRTLRGWVREGSTVTVERAGLGAYHMKVDGKTGFIQVLRVR